MSEAEPPKASRWEWLDEWRRERLAKWLDEWKRERFIRRVLRRLARQRVRLLRHPGDLWSIERAVQYNQRVVNALCTCHMRGWVEPLSDSVPFGDLSAESTVPGYLIKGSKPTYRLTGAGWEVIHGTHRVVVTTLIVATAALAASIIGIFVTFRLAS